MQELIVIQGPPGSGKTTLALQLQREINTNSTRTPAVIFETDDYHYEGDQYCFKLDRLKEFHEANKKRTYAALERGLTVILSNTNIKCWEPRDYVKYAVACGIPVKFLRANGQYQNTHGVPSDRVEQMRNAMEELSLDRVLKSKCPWEVD